MAASAGVRPEDIPIPDWMRKHLRCHATDGLLCVDGAGTILGWNSGLAGTLGLQQDGEWILRPIAGIFGWTDLSEQESLFGAAEKDGSSRGLVALRLTDGGPKLEAELTVTLASEPGEARCFFVYVRMGTPSAPPKASPLDRSFMELQVQHRMLMNRAGGVVLVVDPGRGTVLHANEGSEEYFRTPVAEIRGSSMIALVESVEGFPSEGDPSVFLDQKCREIELTIPSPTGNAWVISFASNTVAWHGTQALMWIGRDVTDRRSSTSVSSSGVRLPASVVTPVAEGLRHPAARIELLARHCLERPDRPWHEQREQLELIQELGDEVRSASEDLLYMTRVADGTLDIRRTETTVGRILAGILPRLRRRARARESEILTVQLDEDATLFADARLLMRSLRGFIERALENPGTTITLTATVQGDCVRFVIIDSGPIAGDDATMERVMDPGSVARASTGELNSLEHLPLMLSVHLFRALGGHVEVQSSPGMGDPGHAHAAVVASVSGSPSLSARFPKSVRTQ